MSSNSFTVLITGANRGIGFGLTQKFLGVKEVTKLFAGVRNPSEAKELRAIKDSRLHIVQIDITDNASIQEACGKVGKEVGSAGLNLLINNAGIMIDVPYNQPNRADSLQVFEVNTISPLVVAQTFLPLLRRASSLHSSKPVGARRAAIITVSSSLGSIGLNNIGSLVPSGQHSLVYRASKAAVNAISKSLSIDLKKDKILVIAQDPGWVRTRMGTQAAHLSLEESTSALLKSILGYGEGDNGGFFSETGQRLAY